MVGHRRSVARLRALLLAAALGGGAAAPALGQDRDLAFDRLAEAGVPPGVPQLPTQGAWGEVINVTPRWIVVQNSTGQQFPVAVEDVREFLIRWPIPLDAVADEVVRQPGRWWAEAVGADAGSNSLRAGHVDVFEGADRSLVEPTNNSILPNNMIVTAVDPGFNRFMNGWDFGGQNLLYGWAYPVMPGLTGIPARLHVAGVLLRPNPLVIGTPGNNTATVLPEDSGRFTVMQVTRGTVDRARKGDIAFLMPLQTAPRGLILSQLVLYKQVPLRQFNPNR